MLVIYGIFVAHVVLFRFHLTETIRASSYTSILYVYTYKYRKIMYGNTQHYQKFSSLRNRIGVWLPVARKNCLLWHAPIYFTILRNNGIDCNFIYIFPFDALFMMCTCDLFFLQSIIMMTRTDVCIIGPFM